jgi:predicted nucleic acid-binding protein
VTLLVDTSVWSLAFRRDVESTAPEVKALRAAIGGGDSIVTTGLILQELLQGFAGPRARKDIVQRFAALPLLAPDRRDYIDAAELRNGCRRSGVQLGTIDALLAQLCIRHDLTILTTDGDFLLAEKHCALKVWKPTR